MNHDWRATMTRRRLFSAARRRRGQRLCAATAGLVVAATVSLSGTMSVRGAAAGYLRLTPAQLAQDERFRSEFGFPGDAGVVRSLYAARDTGALAGWSETYGTLLNAAETAEMRVRSAMQVEANDLNGTFRSYLRKNGATFAGDYFDQRHGGVLVVMFTDNLSHHQSYLATRFSHPERLRLRSAATTLADLNTLNGRVSHDIDTLAAEGVGVRLVATNVQANRVDVGAADAQAAAVVSARYPTAHVDVVRSVVTTGAKGYTDAPPFRGGQEIDGNAQVGPGTVAYYQCTSGFVVSEARGGFFPQTVWYVATAGHCGPSGSAWAQVSVPMGQMAGFTGFYNGSTADVGFIQISSSSALHSNQIFRVNAGSPTPVGAIPIYDTITSVEGYDADTIGETTCFAGTETPYSCGTLVNQNFTANYAFGVTIYHLREATYADTFGDSGGSVYNPGAQRAEGIQSGQVQYSDGTIHSLYSQIGRCLPPNYTLFTG